MTEHTVLLFSLIVLGMAVDTAIIFGVVSIWRILRHVKKAVDEEKEQVGAFIVALDPDTVHELVGLHTKRLNEHDRRLSDHDGRISKLEKEGK